VRDQQIARLASIDFDRRFKDLLDRANRANVSPVISAT